MFPTWDCHSFNDTGDMSHLQYIMTTTHHNMCGPLPLISHLKHLKTQFMMTETCITAKGRSLQQAAITINNHQ